MLAKGFCIVAYMKKSGAYQNLTFLADKRQKSDPLYKSMLLSKLFEKCVSYPKDKDPL